ncbi:hypothetical protein MLD38_001407 [Melastoma candidum]|uniref:Uncharacterized protein n=1 Tax=Melastoma candidum TaxID=119954 RepID=A0ACB9SGG7_9MYRT|nr:hypothetical protein MLD38_001407 [Melastoma candidum]
MGPRENSYRKCNFVDVIDEIPYEDLLDLYSSISLEEASIFNMTKDEDKSAYEVSYMRHMPKIEYLERPISSAKSSIEEPPKLDLKLLPEHLKYSFLEENHKASIEQQRRLNSNMKEVVRKEIIKLLDAGIIFPTSDTHG